MLGVRLAGGVVAVGVAAGLGLQAAAGAYNLQADKIDQEVNTLRIAVAANPPSPVVKELDALRQKDAQQRQVQDALQGSMAWSSQGYSDYLMALGRQTHPSVWITGLNVRGDGRDISLSGRTDNATVLPAYLKRLGQEERFKGRRFAQMDMSALSGSDATAGVVQFTLKGLRKEVVDTTTREAALRALGKLPEEPKKEDAKK